MILRIPRPRNKYPVPEWSNELLTIGNVSDNEFLEMFRRLAPPTRRRLYAGMYKIINGE